MTKGLSAEAVTRFQEQGYYYPVPVLTQEETAYYRRRFQEFEEHHDGKLTGNVRNKSHLFLTWLDELVRHPKILDVVEDLIGPNILLYHAQWFIKEPHTADFVSYHQDSAYWSLDQPQGLSAWIAFMDADLENGCMQVIPGSHRQSLAHVDRKADNNMLWRGQTVDAPIDPSSGVYMQLKAGEMSLHHARIIHGSGPNKSGRRRIGYSVRYLPTHVSRKGSRDSAMLVRGTDAYGHFDAEPRPKADYDPAALATHAAVTQSFMTNYMAADHELKLQDAR